MTIKVFSDRIELGNKIIRPSANGIIIDDALAANTQQQGYIKQANFTARELAYYSVFQGSVAGFNAGGYNYPGAIVNTIDKFSFASDGNAIDSGDLTATTVSAAGQSSTTHGYTSGGFAPVGVNTIQKYSFGTISNATDVGDLTDYGGDTSGLSSSVSGYTGGRRYHPSQGGSVIDKIDKFPFATDTNATNVGSTSPIGFSIYYAYGTSSSPSKGYIAGGSSPPVTNSIVKFPFAADTNVTDIGDLTQARNGDAGQSSSTYGYMSGGYSPTTDRVNTIDKFSFATDSNATDVGDLTVRRNAATGQSSILSGYASGGVPFSPSSVSTNTIDKFPFSADANASDVGDLTVSRYAPSGTQY